MTSADELDLREGDRIRVAYGDYTDGSAEVVVEGNVASTTAATIFLAHSRAAGRQALLPLPRMGAAIEILTYAPRPLPLPREDGVYAIKGARLEDGPLLFKRFRGHWDSHPPATGITAEGLARIWHDERGLVPLAVAS